MTTMTMEIGGMTCGHCVHAVSSALKDLDGVQVEKVSVGSAAVSYDPDSVSPAQITQAIEDEGYQVVGSR
jgi:copper chaperone